MATTVSLKPNAVEISGSTSGTTTLQATAVAGTTTLTLPAATDTLVGKATTDTLTNKTLTGAVMNGTLGATTPSTVAATTLTTSSTVTHNGGTANGVGYLDGSKVLTTGSALVFDGTALASSGSGTQALTVTSTATAAYVQTTGANTVNARLQSNATTASVGTTSNHNFLFQTNATTVGTFDTSGNLLVGATSAADATVRTQSGSTSRDGRIQTWFSTSNGGSFGNLQLGSANTGVNTECSIKFVSGATALGNSPTSANGTQYDWGMGLGTYTAGGNVFAVCCTANGGNNVKLNYNSTSWLTGSDERIKDITGNIENALSIISPWRTVFYTLKTDTSKDVKAGLIAQDVLQTLPEVVDVPVNEYNEKGELIPLSIAYTEIIPVLVKAIQEQQAIITQLQADVAALKGA